MNDAVLLFWLLCLCAYFFPSFIAGVRSKRSMVAIFALNLLLGWTGLGWIGALVWALSSDGPHEIYLVRK